jgi:hypothetical protein
VDHSDGLGCTHSQSECGTYGCSFLFETRSATESRDGSSNYRGAHKGTFIHTHIAILVWLDHQSCVSYRPCSHSYFWLFLFFFQLMPSPKWKLVVEIGAPPKTAGVEQDGSENCQLSNELLSLMCTHMPKDKTDALAPYLPGFTSLHLLLMKRSRSARENEMLKTALASFFNYKLAGHSDSNVAWMTARDCMLLTIQEAQHFANAPTNFALKNNVSAVAASFQQQQLQQPLAQMHQHVTSSRLASGNECNGSACHGSNCNPVAESNSVALSTTPNHVHTSQSNVPIAEMVQLSRSLQGIGHAQNPTQQPSIGHPGTHAVSTAQNDARFFTSLGTEGFSDQLDMSFLSGAATRLSANQFAGTSQHDGSINEFDAYYHP